MFIHLVEYKLLEKNYKKIIDVKNHCVVAKYNYICCVENGLYFISCLHDGLPNL